MSLALSDEEAVAKRLLAGGGVAAVEAAAKHGAAQAGERDPEEASRLGKLTAALYAVQLS